MPNQTYHLFINSKNRLANQTIYDFTVYLKNQIIAGKNQGINISVMSFSMLNSMYNVNPTIKNNTFILEQRNLSNVLVSSTTITIPYGNYTAYTLRDALNGLLANKITVVYNVATNSYTYTNTDNTKIFYIIPNKCNKLLGINETTQILTSGTSGGYINLVNFSHIIIKSPSLEFEDLTQDNISTTDNIMTISNILFVCNKQDFQPFQMISYKNEDGGDSYSFNVINKNISHLNFILYNENNQIIEDAPDFQLELKITIFDKNDELFREIGIQSLSLLDDIYFTLLNILFQKKKYLL